MVLPLAVRMLAKAGIYYGLSRVLSEGVFARQHVQQVAIGAGFIVASLFTAGSAIFAFMLSLFFYLADSPTYIQPALIAGGIVLLVAVLLGWEGVRRIKYPMRR